MEFEIDIQADVAVTYEEVELVETAVITTLQQQAVAPPAMLTVVLTDDAAIRRLNNDYRDTNAPTDVLSFPVGESMPGMAALYLGDIIISVPFATEQAIASGHPAIAELQLLAVHGTLHLLGHDHADVDEKNGMWTAQTAVMTSLNLAHITPTEAAH